MTLNELQLTGRSTDHLVPWSEGVLLHHDVIDPLNDLCLSAANQGFDLVVASGFRSFERQLSIWNAKARGERPVLDEQGNSLDISVMDEESLMWAILRWSALPGASRHHWGTDMDIFDRAAVPDDYCLQLVPEEYQQGGPFFPMTDWLSRQMAAGHPRFYRPYLNDRGGVMPEPWHISFRPVADGCENLIGTDCLASAIEQADILLQDAILKNLDEIVDRFVRPC
ncbi:MAG: M15 family metallopeptidase [bacterium]